MPPGAPFRDRSVPLPQCFRAAMPPPGIHVLIRRFECGFLEFVTEGRTSSLRAENRMDCQFEVGGRARPLQGLDMARGYRRTDQQFRFSPVVRLPIGNIENGEMRTDSGNLFYHSAKGLHLLALG